MTDKARVKKLYLAQQPGGLETDPSADGSTAYAHLQTKELSLIEDTTEVLETEEDTGENVRTASDRAGDGAMVNFKAPFRNYATAGGDAASVDAADTIDMLLQNALGAATTTQGEGAAVGTNISTLALDSDLLAAQDFVPVWENGVNGGRVQWRRVNESVSPYTLDRNFDAAPSDAAVAYATRSYRGPLADDGELLAAYYVLDSKQYTLLGGRLTALKLMAEVRKRIMLEGSIKFDSKSKNAKANIPAVGLHTPDVVKLVRASTTWGGTRYGVKSVELDFGLTTQDIDADNGTNGRSDIETLEVMPVVTLTPQYADAPWVDDFRVGTTRFLMVELGGVNSAGLINSACFGFTGEVIEAPLSEDGKIVRNTVKIQAVFNGIFTAPSTHERFWQFYRA